MYESPIGIIYGEMQTQIENDVLKAVQRVGVNVNKEELLKALQYDREQYSKGYEDGLNANRWIPCSERLPEEYAEVLGFGREGYTYIVMMYDTKIYGKVWRQWNGGELRLDWIVAWMPLPEPYEGE